MKSHLHWQKDCQQTAKVNVFEASASAIILPTTLYHQSQWSVKESQEWKYSH